MIRLLSFCSLALLVLTGCQNSGAPAPAQANREDDIRESVFRYLFAHNDSRQQQNAGGYYLALGAAAEDIDPDPAFLRRFQAHTPPVKSVSQCYLNEVVKDKETGQEGILFRINAIRWQGEQEAAVEGEYYEGRHRAAGALYRLVQEGNRWVVREVKVTWVA